MKAAKWHGFWVRSTESGKFWHLVETTPEGSVVALCGANAPHPVSLPARPQSRFDILHRLCGNCGYSKKLEGVARR